MVWMLSMMAFGLPSRLSDLKITHNVYKKASNFLYAKSMIVNKLRYYFDESVALEFVKSH